MMRKMMKQALYTPISEVYYCDHIMDNTFVRSGLYETEWQLEDRGYIPIGYCANPEYSPSSGIAFVVKDKDDCILWVHIPRALFRCWLRELQLDWKEHPIWKDVVAKGGEG